MYNIPKTFWKDMEKPGFFNYIVYGDSVIGASLITFKFKNEINTLMFEQLWMTLLISKVKVLLVEEDKEYIFFNEKSEFEIQVFDYYNNKIIFKTPKYIMRRIISENIINVITEDDVNVKVTRDHSLINFIDGEYKKIKPLDKELTYLFYNKSDNLVKSTIKAKTIEKYQGTVYDFEVEEFHNFFANRVLVHNTDSLYINLPEVKYDTPEEAVLIADKVSKEINNVITEYTNSEILSKLNVPLEFNKTEYKTELVANAMLLLGVKKNYAYKEIAKKGVIHKTPKIRYVGIPVVRTDFSQFTRDFIRKIIDDIALNENLKEIPISQLLNELSTERFKKLTECLKYFNFKYIGIPGKWGMDNNYKHETYHIIAMRLYNTLTDTETFKPGTSGYSFPIILNSKMLISSKINNSSGNNLYLKKDTDLDKLTFLSVPYNYDEEILQKLFVNFQITIDEQTYWKKLYSTSARRIVEILKNNNVNLPPWDDD
ncbi:MAG: hypothetical protein IPH62_19400 [Ignavibacteriae bacterium]|nr:hypothetical protein [Ignavibacteriota bacterium]